MFVTYLRYFLLTHNIHLEIYHILFIHLPFEGHLGWFCYFACMTNATANIHVNVCDMCFPSLGCISKVDLIIWQLCYQSVFQSACTTWKSHQLHKGCNFSASSSPLLFCLLHDNYVINTHIVGLSCSSLVTNNVEHVSIYFLAIYKFSLERCLFIIIAYFLN